jgi:hypothetical protein
VSILPVFIGCASSSDARLPKLRIDTGYDYFMIHKKVTDSTVPGSLGYQVQYSSYQYVG